MDKARNLIYRCLKCYRVITEKQGSEYLIKSTEGVFSTRKEAQDHVDKLQEQGHTAYEIIR